mmetsp:Transcript_1429/g.2025  ORF Transcript_1429/g.2025 Transcript_1429/m.2025 type:complete len:259 (-) Transcript_1429:878-1654(-)
MLLFVGNCNTPFLSIFPCRDVLIGIRLFEGRRTGFVTVSFFVALPSIPFSFSVTVPILSTEFLFAAAVIVDVALAFIDPLFRILPFANNFPRFNSLYSESLLGTGVAELRGLRILGGGGRIDGGIPDRLSKRRRLKRSLSIDIFTCASSFIFKDIAGPELTSTMYGLRFASIIISNPKYSNVQASCGDFPTIGSTVSKMTCLIFCHKSSVSIPCSFIYSNSFESNHLHPFPTAPFSFFRLELFLLIDEFVRCANKSFE